jgi:choline dehydrogenase-like flavoprotein
MRHSPLHSGNKIYDVCVVGAGPVGLTVALECEAAGMSVLLVEAAQEDGGTQADGLSAVEIVDESRHAAMDVVTRNGLGGTSSAWGGRCVPFDDVDFEPRSFVPHSGWPISNEEMKPWYAKAASYLSCGASEFTSPAVGWEERSDISFRNIERLSSQPRLGPRFKDRLRKSNLLETKFGCSVTGLDLKSAGNSVESLIFASSEQNGQRPSARAFVLAGGGLRTTRILLDLQRRFPLYFGGDAGPLGRFYMGHLTGKIASIVLNDPADVEQFEYTRDADGYWCRRRFTFSRSTLLKQELLNTAFWLGNPPFHDPDHGSAAASCIFLALRVPVVGRFALSRDTFAFHYGSGPARLGQHWTNVIQSPLSGTAGAVRAMKHRLTRSDLRPLFLRNRRGEYALHYHAEQAPNPESRVRLTGDNLDQDKMSVNFHFSDDDVRSVVKSHEVLDKALRESGKGYLRYWRRLEDRSADVWSQSQDGYHQIGTTRMNDDDKLGVVDQNCRVHGFDNLYVAGSSVFPTSSQANPTFGAVAIASRVAAQLRKSLTNHLPTA